MIYIVPFRLFFPFFIAACSLGAGMTCAGVVKGLDVPVGWLIIDHVVVVCFLAILWIARARRPEDVRFCGLNQTAWTVLCGLGYLGGLVLAFFIPFD